jgi:hypothetical protein
MSSRDRRKLPKKNKPTVGKLAPHLRGLPQNRFGGHQTQRMRGFPGWSRGAAGAVRRYTKAECKAVELDMKRRGEL